MDSNKYNPNQINQLPDSPGIYKFYNEKETLIYVGKAKSIKKRVGSYFVKNPTYSRKTLKLVSEINFLEITLVNSEYDALLLENNLIKNHQPKYNILLKDDKTYPYLAITNEPFPKVIATRKINLDGTQYFGPFVNVRSMYMLLELVNKLFTVRTCSLSLTKYNIESHKFKVCLEYHIGNCQGPCEGFQTLEEYKKDIEQVSHILKGNLSIPKAYLSNKMTAAAQALQFELANQYKNKLESLDTYQAKSQIVNPIIGKVDVITIVSDEKGAYLSFMGINQGNIINTQTIEIKKILDESEEEILLFCLLELKEKKISTAKEILTNIEISENINEVNISTPKIGDKRKLIELSLKNALFFKKERNTQADLGKIKEDRVLTQLQQDLQLKTLPKHIECFDNSNLQGTNPVASMVCFKLGKPAKKEYRHYNIKTVVGPDDFASMNEIVGRRYKRLLEENSKLPDLIVIDGGKGQLSAACDALKQLNIYGQVPIIGIAKRLEEIYFPEDSYPIHIAKKSESLKLLQRIRDEAHRFAITFHRQKRSKSTLISSSLIGVKGIGDKTVDTLLKKYKSLKAIKEAPTEDLIALIGKDKTQLLLESIKKEV